LLHLSPHVTLKKYASTPTAAQPYFDDDSAPGATLYESPLGRAVEY